MELKGLNKQQLEAIKKTEGPVMVLAGAGSGKTRVLTYRVAYLIEELGVFPNSILALTFTNKAAREMGERVSKLLDTNLKNLWILTFHSFGARFLRQEIRVLKEYNPSFQIIDDDDQEKICKKIIKESKQDVISHKELISFISAKKNNHYLDKYLNFDILMSLYNDYQNYLIKENLLDFDDLLYLTYRILKDYPDIRDKYRRKFAYILIDEFQDTNKIQFEIIDLLVNDNKNIFVVGDYNQSIYSFRGARVENINQFASDYGIKKDKSKLIKLEENYRSTKTILNIANDVIAKNNSFFKMELYSSLPDGEKATYFVADSNYGEVVYVIREIRKLLAKGYRYKDIAILYRVNALSLGFETEFIKEKIPFVIYGGVGYFSRKEVKDILAYIRLAINYDDDFSFRRIVNTPKRKIGEKQVEALAEKALKLNSSLFMAIDGTNNLLYNFKLLINRIKEFINKNKLEDCIDFIITETGYKEMLKQEEDEDRLDNILELKSILRDLREENEGLTNEEILNNFLLDLALKTDVDNVDENDDKVKLMSFHQAKGLEYKAVFMVAMEQGIFPSYQSMYQEAELEEERRICYVGITRAKETLYFTRCSKRRLYGEDRNQDSSMFLRDISPKYLYDKSSVTYEPKYVNEMRKQKVERSVDFGIDVGDKILHKTFGEGKVVSRSGEIITVAFNVNYGIKQLLRTHPSITKLEK